MKNVKFKCRKCGHIIEIPEKTESVLCGNCTAWNKPRSLFAALDQEPGGEASEGSILQKVSGSIYSEIPGPVAAGKSRQPVPEDENQPAPRPGIFTVVALLFLVIPLVNFIISRFNLPQYITLFVIAAVLFLYLVAKKRS